VEAAGVGHVDELMCERNVEGDRLVPGVEVAGRAVAVGEGLDAALIGMRVYARVPSGGYAEQVVVDRNELVPIPDILDATQAVGIGVNALVARFALERSGVRPGERLLVRGAGGGIGLMVVQLAAAAGATVVAAVRSPDRERLRGLGAQAVVDARADAGEYEVVIDLVAGDDVERYIAGLGSNGRYVIAGTACGMPPETFGRALIAGFRKTIGVSTFSLDSIAPATVNAAATQLLSMAAACQLSSVIDRELPLAEAASAHALLRQGGRFGKLVLRPNQPPPIASRKG
jgi:NADPH:quinone reductase-like Zn-dependent oxidoreductase